MAFAPLVWPLVTEPLSEVSQELNTNPRPCTRVFKAARKRRTLYEASRDFLKASTAYGRNADTGESEAACSRLRHRRRPTAWCGSSRVPARQLQPPQPRRLIR